MKGLGVNSQIASVRLVSPWCKYALYFSIDFYRCFLMNIHQTPDALFNCARLKLFIGQVATSLAQNL